MRGTSRKFKSNLKIQDSCFYFHLFKFSFVLKGSVFFFAERGIYFNHLENIILDQTEFQKVETRILNFQVNNLGQLLLMDFFL